MLLSARDGVLGILEYHIDELCLHLLLYLGCAHDAMVELIDKGRGLLARLAHHLIVSITRDERVLALEHQERILYGGEAKGDSTIGIEGIVLCECGVVHVALPAMNGKAVAESIRQLAVIDARQAVVGDKPVPLTIVNGAVLQQ